MSEPTHRLFVRNPRGDIYQFKEGTLPVCVGEAQRLMKMNGHQHTSNTTVLIVLHRGEEVNDPRGWFYQILPIVRVIEVRANPKGVS